MKRGEILLILLHRKEQPPVSQLRSSCACLHSGAPSVAQIGPAPVATPVTEGSTAGRETEHLGILLQQRQFEMQRIPWALLMYFLAVRQNSSVSKPKKQSLFLDDRLRF